MGESIGEFCWKTTSRIKRHCVMRCYKLLLAAPNPENYRHVNLSDEVCSNTRYKCSLAGLIAATFVGCRPSNNHVIHNILNRFSNNLAHLKWITQSENMLKENITPG